MRVTQLGLWAVSVAAVLGAGAGCQNKVYDENLKLRDENRELRAQNESSAAQHASATDIIKPVDPPSAPAPLVAISPAPQPQLLAPPPAPVPAIAPTADNGLSDLDTTVDLKAGTTTVNFVGDALFDPGQVVLRQTARTSLDKVAKALKSNFSGKTVKVQGHTDNDPIKHSKWKDNQELSQARANAVRDYLLSKGVDASLVSAEGMGSTHPKDPTATLAAKAKNRRVEIVVMGR